MAIDVIVPNLGESVKQAKLLKWHKHDGDAVKTDEPLCELETDKANVDVPAQSSGVIHLKKREGDTVDVDEVIAEIDPAGNGASAGASSAPVSQKPAPSVAPSSANPTEDYSPAVRRLLTENQFDPKSIAGTGPKGRLTKEDVESYLAARKKPTAVSQSVQATVAPPVVPIPAP